MDVVLCDLRMPGMDGMELLPQIGRRLPGATVIMMSAYGTADLAIEAMKRGAYDYLAKPFQPSELLLDDSQGQGAGAFAPRQCASSARRRPRRRGAADRGGIARDDRGPRASGASRRVQGDRTADRGERNRQGGSRPGDSRPIRAPKRGLRRRQLWRDPRDAAGERALRSLQGRFHRRRSRPPRALRRGGRWHPLPGRDRGAPERPSGEAATHPPGRGGAPGRRVEVPQGGRPGPRRHCPRPRS